MDVRSTLESSVVVRRMLSEPLRGVLASNDAIVNAWYAVARTVDVTAQAPHAVTLLERKLVLWRDGRGGVVVAVDRCPHREAPLSKGTVKDGCVTCPYHGWVFGDEGRCVRVPSAAEHVPVPPRAHLQTVRCQVRYDLVWVCLGEPASRIPLSAYEDDPSFRRINTPVKVWHTSATRMADNFCDITHFPYVHAGTFGGGQDTIVPKVELGPLDDGYYGYSYEVVADNALGSQASGQTADHVTRTMSTGFQLPLAVRSTIRYESGLEHIILMLTAPIDDVTSYFTFIIWRNDDFSVSAEEVVRFDRAIGAEDKRMLEMVPGMLPLDQTTLVSVQADKCSVEWRRQLVAAMDAADAPRPPAALPE